MTQKKLRLRITEVRQLREAGFLDPTTYEKELINIINQHILEVIGDDTPLTSSMRSNNYNVALIRNQLRQTQRNHAGLPKGGSYNNNTS